MQLETERLLLSEWQEEDFPAFRPIATHPEVMRYIMDGQPWPDERIHDFIRTQRERMATYGWCRWKLTLKSTRKLIGFCGPGIMHDMEYPELGWWLARHVWGQGLATEAARAALADCMLRAGLERLVSVANRENTASIRIMQKIGLKYWRDAEHSGQPSVVYTMERENYQE
jgi:RimJ/RimL family protein N-acetyltransferase